MSWRVRARRFCATWTRCERSRRRQLSALVASSCEAERWSCTSVWPSECGSWRPGSWLSATSLGKSSPKIFIWLSFRIVWQTNENRQRPDLNLRFPSLMQLVAQLGLFFLGVSSWAIQSAELRLKYLYRTSCKLDSKSKHLSSRFSLTFGLLGLSTWVDWPTEPPRSRVGLLVFKFPFSLFILSE